MLERERFLTAFFLTFTQTGKTESDSDEDDKDDKKAESAKQNDDDDDDGLDDLSSGSDSGSSGNGLIFEMCLLKHPHTKLIAELTATRGRSLARSSVRSMSQSHAMPV